MGDLVAMNQFESDGERRVRSACRVVYPIGKLMIRERLLSNIAQLVTKFVHDVSIKSGLSEKVANEAGGRIYTSGSYR
jgi:poly(A) polymerase